MASVELVINGKSYNIACDPGEETRVKALGRMIDDKARQLGSAASDAQRFLMVCLLLADELDEAKALGGGDEGDHQLLVSAVDHLVQRIDHIATSLAQP